MHEPKPLPPSKPIDWHLSVGGDAFHLTGAFTVPDALALFTAWAGQRGDSTASQAKLDALTAKLSQSTTVLDTTVTDNP